MRDDYGQVFLDSGLDSAGTMGHTVDARGCGLIVEVHVCMGHVSLDLVLDSVRTMGFSYGTLWLILRLIFIVILGLTLICCS